MTATLRPLLFLCATSVLAAAPTPALRQLVAEKVAADYPALDAFYQDLHAHPELSLQEARTAQKLAAELRAAGCDVTENFGGHGLVALLKNGPGPTLLLRTDLDALPVAEETGLPYASAARATDPTGREVPVMHACGHDIHMTVLAGTARELAALREHWSGTVLFIGQPAEERGLGARDMLAAGLYQKFPRPDFAIAEHDSASLPVGTVAVSPGAVMANVDWVEITVRGRGGHGAYPQMTKDPVVLAARIVLALQTIVSRETSPIDPCVVTVGSIHGGAKANVIPDEVKLSLTLRSYSPAVRDHTIAAIQRICRGEGIAAGLPDDLLPLVNTAADVPTPATRNDPALTQRVHDALAAWLGADRVVPFTPEMGGEDFSRFGLTDEHVPLCLFRVGAVAPEKIAESQRTGIPLPSLHSSKFAPVPEPTIKTGITAMTATVLELLTPVISPANSRS
ncbi:amidohydrolase [Horticoccus luteus]|uniref:Amidohydrolase n=1 Tax=Horticoccus luteus TaxID=2862869 RepID=A0A8F9TX64_9BACT|nr:amidohydrolase [Horticoccus luteus]QYM79489.1 amidohydrolase [Horticoccus luteus]